MADIDYVPPARAYTDLYTAAFYLHQV